jgi:hypothetical protein
VGTLVIMPIGGKLVLKGGLAVSSSGVEKLKKKKKTTKVSDEPDEEQKKKHEEERECKAFKNAECLDAHLASVDVHGAFPKLFVPLLPRNKLCSTYICAQ